MLATYILLPQLKKKKQVLSLEQSTYQVALESGILKSLQVSPFKERWEQVPEAPSLSCSVACQPARQVAKGWGRRACYKPSRDLSEPYLSSAEMKMSVQAILISARQQILLHRDWSLGKNGLWLRLSFFCIPMKKVFRRIFLASLTQLKSQTNLLVIFR